MKMQFSDLKQDVHKIKLVTKENNWETEMNEITMSQKKLRRDEWNEKNGRWMRLRKRKGKWTE